MLLLFVLALAVSVIYIGSIILFLLPYRKVRPRKVLPFVSIIIATRNEEAVIEKTLKNLRKLDYPRFEIIIVDSSTDKTPKIARKYADKFIIEKRPQGKSHALNMGIKKARGEIIYVIDSDSLPEKTALKNLVQYLNGEYDAVVGLNLPQNRNGIVSVIGRLELAFLNLVDKTINSIIKTALIPGRNFVIYKKTLKKVGGFEKALTEDVNISWRLYKIGKKIGITPAVAREQVPDKFSWYIKQQERWTRGSLHEIRISLSHLSISEILIFLPAILFLSSVPFVIMIALVLYIITGIAYLLIPFLLGIFILFLAAIRYLDATDAIYFPFSVLVFGAVQAYILLVVAVKSTLGQRTLWYKTPKEKI